MPLRLATPDDIDAIARVHVRAWEETYPSLMPAAAIAEMSLDRRRRQWQRAFSEPGGPQGLWVATDDEGAVVGFAQGGPNRTPEHPYAGELLVIYLLQSQQGRGYGRALFQAVVHDLVARGMPSMLLWVIDKSPTVGFYEAMGGRAFTTATFAIAGHPLVEIGMGWPHLDP